MTDETLSSGYVIPRVTGVPDDQRALIKQVLYMCGAMDHAPTMEHRIALADSLTEGLLRSGLRVSAENQLHTMEYVDDLRKVDHSKYVLLYHPLMEVPHDDN